MGHLERVGGYAPLKLIRAEEARYKELYQTDSDPMLCPVELLFFLPVLASVWRLILSRQAKAVLGTTAEQVFHNTSFAFEEQAAQKYGPDLNQKFAPNDRAFCFKAGVEGHGTQSLMTQFAEDVIYHPMVEKKISGGLKDWSLFASIKVDELKQSSVITFVFVPNREMS